MEDAISLLVSVTMIMSDAISTNPVSLVLHTDKTPAEKEENLDLLFQSEKEKNILSLLKNAEELTQQCTTAKSPPLSFISIDNKNTSLNDSFTDDIFGSTCQVNINLPEFFFSFT